MSQLIEGVKIVYTPLSITNLEDRVFLNSGTKQASNAINNELILYAKTVIIPQKSWRKPRKVEQKILFNNQFDQEAEFWVTIVKLPQEIKNHLKILKDVKEPRILQSTLEKKMLLIVLN